MVRTDATAKKRGGVFLWISPALLMGLSAVTEVRADQAQCESIYQSIEASALEDGRKLPAIAKLSPEAARKKFANQFAPLDATVSADGTVFSASKMLAQLWKLYGLTRASGQCSSELAQLLSTVAFVEFKRDHPVEGSLYAEAALAINDLSTPELVSDAIKLHDQVANAATDPAVAIKHMRAAVDLAPRDLSLVPLQRFGLRQRLGYWLDEGHLAAEAQQVNMQLLADAERELGKDHEALLTVLENLAQNHYELNQLDAARSYLQRCLALARQHARPEVESRMLFQMGVLAHEQGNDDEARRYMKERVEHAKPNPDFGLLDSAQSSLAELELRIAEERKSPAPSPGAH